LDFSLEKKTEKAQVFIAQSSSNPSHAGFGETKRITEKTHFQNIEGMGHKTDGICNASGNSIQIRMQLYFVYLCGPEPELHDDRC